MPKYILVVQNFVQVKILSSIYETTIIIIKTHIYYERHYAFSHCCPLFIFL
jgi:hypothetical protein